MNYPKILIVDDEHDIREILSYIVQSRGNFHVDFAESGNIAVEKIKVENYDVVISDYNMPDGNGDVVFQYILDQKIATRFILCSSDQLTLHPIFVKNKIYDYIEKPNILPALEVIIDKILIEFDAISEFENKYIPLTINLIKKFNTAPVDLFVKISDEKLLKVAIAGDVIIQDDYVKYQDKSINHLYVEFKDRDIVITKLMDDILTLARRTDLIFDQKFSSMQEMMANAAKNFGFNQEISKVVVESVTEAMKSINKDLKVSQLLNLLLDNPNFYLAKVSVICTHVTVAIVSNCESIHINTLDNLNKLVLATLIQDLSLDILKFKTHADYQKFIAKDPKLGQETIANFSQHPINSSKLVNSKNNLFIDLEKIISEHHELPDGCGFPRHLSGNRINALSSILIIGNCIADIMLNSKFQNKPNDFYKMIITLEEKFKSNAHFSSMIIALKKSDLFS